MRWIVRIGLALVAVVALGLGALVLFPTERIARIATERFEAATGREMTIAGDIRPSIYPVLGVSTGPVTIANADWSDAGPLLTADGLSLGVDLMALIGGDIHITHVAADAPEVLLEIAADGRRNWDMSDPVTAEAAQPDDVPETVETPGGLPVFAVDEARVTAGHVVFIDHSAGRRTEVSAIDLTAHLPDFAGAADAQVSAVMNGQQIGAEVAVSQLSAFLQAGAVPVSVAATVGDNSLSFEGRGGLSPVAAGGHLSADVAAMADLFALLDQPAPAIPEGLGRRIALDAEVTATDQARLTLRDGTLTLDGNRLAVEADVDLAGAKPNIVGRITGGALDLSALGGGSGGGGGGATGDGAATGWPTDSIDVTALHTVNADISMQAESIDLGVVTLGRTNLRTTLADGRAVTELRELGAYGGTVAGAFVVNGNGGLSVRANLTGAGLALQPLLEQAADYDRLDAPAEFTLNLLGVGNSIDALMRSLSGDGALGLGQGELRGLDIAGMVRNMDASYVGEGQKTIFDSVAMTFAIDGGVLRNDDFALAAPLLTATGEGTVGIGAQVLDYRLLPVLLEQQTGQGLRVPLIISGPWADPRFRLDLESLVEQEFGDEIEELKTRAETVVTDKISEELGVEVDSLDNIEDTLKEELTNRAAGELLKLLGGN
ncbi:MAG: AsmA family protein [Maritimibacter sp.]|nr:AsmA family protein [Maritimibacter sp.]